MILAIAGSAIFAVLSGRHRTTWIVLGALLVIILLVTAAYRQWHELHADLGKNDGSLRR